MSTNKKQFTMRMQPETYDKIRVISAINKRSIAMQIEYLIDNCISEYESRFGNVPVADERKNVNIVQENQNGNNNFFGNKLT